MEKQEKSESMGEKEILELEKEEQRKRIHRPPGYYSNMAIRERNRGVKHQFEDDIGGCSANYR